MRRFGTLAVLAISGALLAFGSQDPDYSRYKLVFSCKMEDLATQNKVKEALRGLDYICVGVHGCYSYDVTKKEVATARRRLNKAKLHSLKGGGMLGKVIVSRGTKAIGH